MAVQGRAARLTALALVTGTIVAASTGVAGASAADVRQMTATGTGSALKITINLPAAAAAVLGTSHIEQTISLTDGRISTVGVPSAETTAILGKGNIAVVSNLLAEATKASLGGKTEDTRNDLPAIDTAGIKAQLLPLSSRVADPSTVTSGVVSKSSSAVAHLGITLPLSAAQAVTAPVSTVLNTALDTTSTSSSTAATVASTVDGAISTLNSATNNQSAPLTAPVQAAVDGAVTTLTSTLGSLNTTLAQLTSGTELLSLDSITSDQTISRNGPALTSDVANTVKNISVLNGLVKVAAITSQATATAGGAPGTAQATTNAPVFKVDVAQGALTALLDQTGLNVTSNITGPLPADLQNAVNGALSAVNGLLNQVAGIDVAIGKGSTSAAPDGTSAAAQVATTVLTVDPPVLHTAGLLPASQKFLTLELVSANAAVANQVLLAEQTAAPASLPRTGGSLPLAIAATVTLGAALVIRRRRAAQA